MGALWSLFFKPPERRPLPTGYGFVNAFKNNWRGLVSTVLAIVIFGVLFKPVQKSENTVMAIWAIMFVFMLLQPMPASACALMPLFALPMCGIMTSDQCCYALINENTIMLFLGGWLLLLFNNCGLDKRLICAMMSGSTPESYTPVKLLVKASSAALFVSVVSDRALVTKAIMEYIVSALQPLQILKTECDYVALKNVLCVSVAVNALVGSMVFIHASLTTLQLRAMYQDSPMKTFEFSDTLNYLDYTCYSIPVVATMFLLCLGGNALLVSRVVGQKPMSVFSKQALQTTFAKNKSDLGPMTNHEKISIFFYILFMLTILTRWSEARRWGWASYRFIDSILVRGMNAVPAKDGLLAVKDATVAALFVVVLHFLPKSLDFMKIWSVSKVRDLPKMRPESGILYWKFVDKHTDYALFFIIGAGLMMQHATAAYTTLNQTILHSFGIFVMILPWPVSILIVVLVSVFLGNIMTGMAAQACLMPAILGLPEATARINPWTLKRHLLALGVGLGSGFGFCYPHVHTPSYYVRHIGKVDLKKQILYSVPSTIICAIILWLSLIWWGPTSLAEANRFIIVDLLGDLIPTPTSTLPTVATEAPGILEPENPPKPGGQ